MVVSRRSRLTTLAAGVAAILTIGLGRGAAAQGVRRLLPPVAYQRLDSLEQAALTAPTSAQRLDAVTTITSIGLGQGTCAFGPTPSVIKYPGLANRLATIYRRSPDASLRDAILWKMMWNAECADAAAFLGSVNK